MGKKAILFGASGLTGGHLLEELIEDDRFEKIYLFNRRELGVENEKVVEIVSDLFELDKYSEEIDADVVFVNIGSTRKKTPDLDLYRKIDYGIPKAAAELAKRNNIETFMVVSSMSANSESSNFYMKMKGDMENAVRNADIKRTYILQPSLIVGNRKESRLGEGFGEVLLKILKPILQGSAKKFRSIQAKTIAKAMKNLVFEDFESQTFKSDRIQDLGEK